MRYTDSDPLPAQMGRLGLQRTYDSHHRFRGTFGRGWSSLFDQRLAVTPLGTLGETVAVMTGRNESAVFMRARTDPYKQLAPVGATGKLTRDDAGQVFRYLPGGSTTEQLYRYSDGRFAGLRDLATGRRMTITYDGNGLPASVADSWTDLTWTVTTDLAKRRITSITAGGFTWTYQYDSQDNLQSVLAPGGSTWRTYEHTNDLMTVARDALGNLIEAHDYDSSGRAINSTGPRDEIASIAYNVAGSTATQRITRVTSKSGAVADYVMEAAGGAWRTVRVDGGCSSCGARNTTHVYDSDGHAIREQDASGYITRNTWADNLLVSREHPLRPSNCDPETDPARCRLTPTALAAATLEPVDQTLTTTYEYSDAVWRDRPNRIRTSSVVAGATTGRDEFITYHPSGVEASRTVSGWTLGPNGPRLEQITTRTALYGDAAEGQSAPYAPAFDPGSPSFPSAFMSMAQPGGLTRSADGPRTDVSDVTLFVYYPIHADVAARLRGRLAATKNALGHVTRYEDYDLFGNVTRIVDANGVATESAYDSLGRALTQTIKGVAGCDTVADPLCASNLTTNRTFNPAAGPLVVETRAGGGVTTYTYDERGRVKTISRGPSTADLRERIEYAYDANHGKKSSERSLAFEGGSWAEKRIESYLYDVQSELEHVVHADQTRMTYAYDPDGKVATIRDERHASPNTSYAYDAADRLSKVTQTLSSAPGGTAITRYGYDRHGNLTSVTDPNGNVTTYIYDDFGRMLRQVSPVTGATTYTYDAAGNLLSSFMANGTSIVRTYDALNRVLTSLSEPGSDTVIWTYDDAMAGRFGIGRVATMTDETGNTSYAYERRGALREEVRNATTVYTTRYRYDADGNRSAIIYPSQLTVSYTFDHAGRPLTATGVITDAKYLPFGPLTGLQFANGTVQELAYDTRYRMTRNQLTDMGTSLKLADYSYASDAAGNIERIDDVLAPEYNRTFAYDDLNRLITANTGAGLWNTGEYKWDAMGNILSTKLGEIAPGGDDGLLRRRGISVDANRPRGRSSTFTYAGTTPVVAEVTTNDLLRPVTHDAAGNETAHVVTRDYSARNLLRTVGDLGEPGTSEHRLAYKYDGRGIRVTREETPVSSPSGAVRGYFYTPELSLLAVTRDSVANWWDGSADPISGQPYLHEIIWFGNRPVGQVTSGSTRFTFADHLATPILQTDATRSVIWRAEYEPFGNLYELRAGNRTDQPLRFPGQEVAMTWEGYEENYNIFRWYRAGWGRYTQPDPLQNIPGIFVPEVAPGTVVTSDPLYTYARANPIVNVDPRGLKTCNGACPDCPSGEWAYIDVGVSAALIFGKARGQTTYFCRGNGLRCTLRYECTTVGIQSIVGGYGGSGAVGGTNCKCASDLTDSSSLVIGPMQFTQGSCSGLGGTGGPSWPTGRMGVFGITGCKYSRIRCSSTL